MAGESRAAIEAELARIELELTRVNQVLESALPKRVGLFKKSAGDLQLAQRAIADQRRLVDRRNDLRYQLKLCQ